MKEALIKALTSLAEQNPRIMLITGDLGFGVIEEYVRRFPKQFLNIGVAEQNMTSIATGLAVEGRIVFTYSISNFPTLRCLEQVRNDAIYHEANVKIVSIGAGFSYGAVGFSHHATEDVSIMRSLPGISICTPGCDWEAIECTNEFASMPGVGLLRLDRAPCKSTRMANEKFQFGIARRLAEGSDITLATTGSMVQEALMAVDILKRQGISCRLLHFPTICPLDTKALEAAARETGGVVTIEEHTIRGGFGGYVAEELLESSVYPKKFLRLGLRGEFSSKIGSQDYLRCCYRLDKSSIASQVYELCRHKGPLDSSVTQVPQS